MNPTFDTILGKRRDGIFNQMAYADIKPVLNMQNLAEDLSPFETSNIAYNKGFYKRDPNEVERERASGAEVSDFATFDGLEDSFLSDGGKKLSRHIGYITGSGTTGYDKDGNVVSIPKAKIIDPVSGKLKEEYDANELWARGEIGDILDVMNANKSVSKTKGEDSGKELANGLLGDPRFEVRSYFYPVYDPQYGWIYQEVIGTKKEIDKVELAGATITNQYGPQSLSTDVATAFGKSLVHTVTDLGRSLHQAGTAGLDILESFNNLADKGEFKSEYDSSNAFSDYWRWMNQNQDYMNKKSVRESSDNIFDNPVSFAGGLGQGIGSLLQYGALGRMSNILAKAGSLTNATSGLMTAGTIINFGEAYEEAKDAGLDDTDAAILGLSTGYINALIETKFGANVLQGWLAKGGGKSTAKMVTEELGGDIKQLANATVKNNIISKIDNAVATELGKGVIGSAIEEGSEEAMQGLVKQSMQTMYDAFFASSDVKGEGYFGTNPFTWDAVSQNLQDFAMGAIIGGSMSPMAFRAENRARKSGSIAYVARNEEDALYEGAKLALESKAISQDEHDTFLKDTQRLVDIRNSNYDTFAQVASISPVYRTQAAESVMSQLSENDAFVEVNKDNNLNSQSKYDDNVKKDYINSLEEQASLNTETYISTTNENGTISNTPVGISTVPSFIYQLRQAGKNNEADLVERSYKDSSKKAKSIFNQSKSQFADVPQSVRSNVERTFLNNTTNSIYNLQLNRQLNRERNKVLADDLNQILNESNNIDPGKLGNIEGKIVEKLNTKFGDIGKIIKDAYLKDKELLKKNENPIHVDKLKKDIASTIDSQRASNKAVANIDDLAKNFKTRYNVLLDDVIDELELNDLLNKDTTKGWVDDITKEINKANELEAQGAKDSTKPLDNARDRSKDADAAEISKLLGDVDSLINEHNTTFNSDKISAKFKDNGDGTYSYTIANDKTGSVENMIPAKTIEEAISQYKIALKSAIERTGDDATNKTSVDLERDKSNVDATDTSGNVVIKTEKRIAPGSIHSSIGINKDSTPANIEFYNYINNPLTSVNNLGGGTFSISANPIKGTKGEAILKIFGKLSGVEAFDKLSETTRKEIIDYLPISYTFDHKTGSYSKHTVYLNDRLSFKDNELTEDLRNVRKFIISNLLKNNHKYSPENLVFTKYNWKYNTVKNTDNINSDLSGIKSLRIKRNEDGNYVHRYTLPNSKEQIERPVHIGIANDDGAIIFYDGTEEKFATGTGIHDNSSNAGNVYLVLPADLYMDHIDNRPINLNATKVSNTTAGMLYDILLDVANGTLDPTSNVDVDNKYGIKIGDVKFKYENLLDTLVANGPRTLNYNRAGGREYLSNKVLFADNTSLTLKYGNNPETGAPFIVDSTKSTAADKESFVNWMTNNKNYSVSSNMLRANKSVPAFQLGDVISNGGSYVSFLLDNSIVQSNLNPTGPLFTNTKLNITIPQVISDVSTTKIPKRDTPVKSKSTTVAPANTVTSKADTDKAGLELADSIFHVNNNINYASDTNKVIKFLDNVFRVSKSKPRLYLASNVTFNEFRTLSNEDRMSTIKDITEDFNILRNIYNNEFRAYALDPKKKRPFGNMFAKYIDTYAKIKGWVATDDESNFRYPVLLVGKNESDPNPEPVQKSIAEANTVKANDEVNTVAAPVDNKSAIDIIKDELQRAAREQLGEESITVVSDAEFEAMEGEWDKYTDTELLDDANKYTREITDDLDNIVVQDLAVEKQTYRDMLSSFTGGNIVMSDKIVEVMQRSGNPKYAWASMNIDGVTLYNGAESGTLYHEAFHRVSLLYLDSADRAKLYKDARKEFNLPDSSDLTIEERLAEDFRSYVLSNAPTRNGFLGRMWQSLKDFISQFIFNKKPSYTSLETLYKGIRDGQYRYIRASKESILRFKNQYPGSDVGFTVGNVVFNDISSNSEFYDIVKTLTAVTLNANGIEAIANNHTQVLDFKETINTVITYAKLNENRWKDARSSEIYTNSDLAKQSAIDARYLRRRNIYREILGDVETKDTFYNVFIPAIYSRLNSLGWKSTELLEDLRDLDNAHAFNNVRNDEIKSAYEFSAKDSATTDIKLLFATLRKDSKPNTLTGLPNYMPYDEAWFEVFRALNGAINLTEMLDRIKGRADQLNEKNGNNVNMWSSLYDKLTGDNSSELLRTRFWTVLKKHRHHFMNVYIRQTPSSVSYSIKDADVNKRSIPTMRSWSIQFAIDGKHQLQNGVIHPDVMFAKKEWNDIKGMVRRGKVNKSNVDTTINRIANLFNKINVNIDPDTVLLMLSDYDNSFLQDDKIKIDRLSKFFADSNMVSGNKHDLNYLFDTILTNTQYGVLGKSEFEFNDKKVDSEKYLESQPSLRWISDKYILANPTIEDDMILGSEGTSKYAYSEFNHLTQTFEDYLKDPEYVNQLSNVTFNESSLWVRSLLEPSFNSKKVHVITQSSFLELDAMDTGRDYTDLSDVEDVMMKMTMINNGYFPVPTLANKKTFYGIGGFPMHRTNLVFNTGTKNLGLDSETINIFTDYLKSEYKVIKEAYALRDVTLKNAGLSLSQFNGMSEEEQDTHKHLFKSLVENYHYISKNGVMNLSSGNGYKFRYFQSFNGQDISKLDETFRETNNNNLKDIVRRSLISVINDNINFLSDLGIIETSKDIKLDNSIGTDGNGDIIITGIDMLDSRIVSRYNKEEDAYSDDGRFKPRAALNMLTDYVINTAIGIIEFHKTTGFDTAFYKNDDDITKRYSMHASTGIVSRTDWDGIISPSSQYTTEAELSKYGIPANKLKNFNVVHLRSNIVTNLDTYNTVLNNYVTLKDGKPSGYLYDLYRRFWEQANDPNTDLKLYARFRGITEEQLYDIALRDAENKLDGYKSSDQTDAQAFITDEMYRRIQMNTGEWNDTKEVAYQLLTSDRPLSIDEEILAYDTISLPVYKMVYVGPSFENNLAIPMYYKMSLAPLFKRMVAGRDLETLYNGMIENDIQLSLFDSAVKAGGRPTIKTYTNDTQQLLNTFAENLAVDGYKHNRDFKFLRKQLNTDAHEAGQMMVGSQTIKVGMSGVENDTIYDVNGTSMSGKELKELNQEVIRNQTERGYNKFREVLGIDEQGKVNKNRLTDMLRDSAVNSNLAENLINNLEVDNTGKYKVELSAFPSLAWIHSRVLATMKNDIVDTKLNGNAFIQMSNFGFKKSGMEFRTASDRFKIGNELVFKKNANKLEAVVSINIFKPFLPQISDGKGGLRDMTFSEAREAILNSDLSTMGYRIPTQGQNMILPLQIVDVLPDSYGDVVIAPSNFTTLTGSDFDIDKLYMVSYNYDYDQTTNSLVKVEYNMDDIRSNMDNVSERQLQNFLLDTYMSVLTSNNHYIETTSPLDSTTAPIKDIVKIIDKIEKSNNNVSNLYKVSPKYQSEVKSQNVGADAGIGPMALMNTNHTFTSIANMSMNTESDNEETTRILNGFNIGPLYRKYDNEGVLILDRTSAMIDAHVDASKNPYILKLNVNRYSYAMVGLLLRSGYGTNTFRLSAQPIIKQFADAYIRYNFGRLGINPRSNIKYTFRNEVIDRFQDTYDDLKNKENFSPKYTFGSQEAVDLLNNEEFLVNQLETPMNKRGAEWYYNQLMIANAWTTAEPYAKALSNMITYTQMDTAKYGSNPTKIQLYLAGIDRMLDPEKNLINSPNDIFDKTFLGAKKQYTIDRYFEMFSNEFIDMTQGFQKLIQTILKETNNYRYTTDNVINSISRELQYALTKDFFDTYAKENNINVKKLFVGNDSLVNRYRALMSLISSDNNFSSLNNNVLLNMLQPNATDATYSEKTGKPQFFNVFVMKEKGADATNAYTAAFREILTHKLKTVRDFGRDLMLYTYLTSGGTNGGLNNMMNLLPFEIYANLELEDGTTYNRFIRNRINYLNGDNVTNADLSKYKDTIYRNLWNSRHIVPVIGTGTLSDTGHLNISANDELNVIAKQNIYTIDKKPTGIKSNPHIVMSSTFGNSYGFSKDVDGKYLFRPYVTVEASNKDKVLYKYVGYVEVEKGDDTHIHPIYRLDNKLGYRETPYMLKELSDVSALDENNKYNSNNVEVKFLPKFIESYFDGELYNITMLDNSTNGIVYSKPQDDLSEDAANVDKPAIAENTASISNEGVDVMSNLASDMATQSINLIVQFPEDVANATEFVGTEALSIFDGEVSLNTWFNSADGEKTVSVANVLFKTSDKPVTIIRHESYYDNDIKGSMKWRVDNVAEMDIPLGIPATDIKLIEYAVQNNIEHVIFGESTPEIKLDTNNINSNKEELISYVNQNMNGNKEVLAVIEQATTMQELSEIIQKYICK